ncbi:MAG: 4-(cytidine 5'-diphospho)-2-C-methyl-D-erythritol kinase [Acidobacteria bacterium]|nr:4-(cytidine 5'-diphospho)-2-C-methyl-D-erythritol kinase [Acidobacteriota bacterium]
MPTTVRSHAKINLGLYIGAPRPDGYHPLATVYQTLELHDFVTVTAHPDTETSIRLTSNDHRVPTDSRNTAWKMVASALQDSGTSASVSIYIDKRLPIQGGLGAGSANAIAALVGLETELERVGQTERALTSRAATWLNPSQFAQNMGVPSNETLDLNTGNWPSRQLDLAAQVGSDVPLFLIGGAVLGRGRGEIVYPLPDFESTWCVVATPPIGVSTPQAFRDWDTLCASEGLTVDASEDRLEQLSRAYVRAFSEAMHGKGSSGVPANDRDLAGPQESALVRTGITSWIQNDFERVVFPQHPSLAEIKRLLAADGHPEAACPASSLLASLSGSGSALFGLYLTREHAQAAQQRLTAAGVRSKITQTLPRSKYWSEMIVE